MTPPILDVTWLSMLTAIVVAYYALLMATSFVLSLGKPSLATEAMPFVVVVIPARNEQAVIEVTLRSLQCLRYPDRLVLVMDDGSDDATVDIVESVRGPSPMRLVCRSAAEAGNGKGAVLNHAYRVIHELMAEDGSCLAGRAAWDVVIAVMDADGQLESDALNHVAPMFSDLRVGGVQIGVRIANAQTNVLTRMQDIEFVGFSGLVQTARNAFGSVGLGGNGQFVRLSALDSLGRDPWTHCLSEDLDLSLSLVRAGHLVRFCPDTYVAQQGLTELGRLFRQRSRWVQGHYQCWRHIPHLLANRLVPLKTKLDLCLYLSMITFVLVITLGLGLSALSAAGVVVLSNEFLSDLPSSFLRNLLTFGLSFGPALSFVVIYQLRAKNPLRAWEIPAFAAFFCLYGYHWVIAQLWALGRMSLGRQDWSKTPRVEAVGVDA